MIAVYLRVSSQSQTTESQKADIQRWLKNNVVPSEDVAWFEDIESGRTTERREFQRLQQAIFDGEAKTVVVWKLDRLSRKQRDGINIIADWCEKGVRIVSVTQQLDLNGAVGRIVAGVLFGVVEMELQHVKERQAAGIAAAKARGVYNDHGRRRGTTKASPKRAIELRQQGFRAAEIANALGVSRSVVYEYLKSA